MKNNNKNECALLINGFDRELKAKFKSHCYNRGRTMKQVIIKLIKEKIKLKH